MAGPGNAVPTEFQLPPNQFRSLITKDGPHQPEKGRYVLYHAWVSPYSTIALIALKLKGLESTIEVAIPHEHRGPQAWAFAQGCEHCTLEPVYGAEYLSELYKKADPNYSSRILIPMLWDRKTETIVSNDFGDMVRMFDSQFDEFVPQDCKDVRLCPETMISELDEKNQWLYDNINHGVYKAGFATVQEVYDRNLRVLFETFNQIEDTLRGKTFLCGQGQGQLTEADIRLFATVTRFDIVYHGLFKCNLRTIRHGYPNIDRWARNLYWSYPAFKSSTLFAHMKADYYKGARHINPSGVIAQGPEPDILGPVDT